MVNFDDLRRSTEEDYDDYDFEDEESASMAPVTQQRFLGMTALERMFISMFFFMNVAVLGIALLLATGRIGG
ncbi:MAG: hypothetical protein EA396_14760 [Anaerolineaceae bacterium]|nr:MAG: hypothetical protein EA396_14760 [Anaerolineaceae bacterium]